MPDKKTFKDKTLDLLLKPLKLAGSFGKFLILDGSDKDIHPGPFLLTLVVAGYYMGLAQLSLAMTFTASAVISNLAMSFLAAVLFFKVAQQVSREPIKTLRNGLLALVVMTVPRILILLAYSNPSVTLASGTAYFVSTSLLSTFNFLRNMAIITGIPAVIMGIGTGIYTGLSTLIYAVRIPQAISFVIGLPHLITGSSLFYPTIAVALTASAIKASHSETIISPTINVLNPEGRRVNHSPTNQYNTSF